MLGGKTGAQEAGGSGYEAGGKRPGHKRLGVSKQGVTWNTGGNSKLFMRLSSQPKSRR